MCLSGRAYIIEQVNLYGFSTIQIALKKPLFTSAVIYQSRICKSNAWFTNAALVIAAFVNAIPLTRSPDLEAYTNAATKNSRTYK